MAWTITETSQIDAKASDRLGNKFLTGNGYMGYRGTLEEYTKEQRTATIVSGLYDKAGDLWREPVNMPNGGYIQVVYQGKPLHAQTSPLERHSQSLDIRHAVHERSTTFLAEDGNAITVTSKRFTSAAAQHLFCMQFTIEASRECDLVVHLGIDGDVWDLNGPHLAGFKTSVEAPVISLTARTQEKGVLVAVCECAAWAGGETAYIQSEKNIFRELKLAVTPAHPQTITKYVSLYTGIDAPDPLPAARDLCRAAAQTGFEQLLEKHCACWEQRWQGCDIQIGGDEDAQLALRFSMYHLLSIAPAHSDRVSIPARGLSGQVYKGGIFWDTEIFMLPFFSHEFPEIARNLLMYRFHTLDGARRKAREYGFRGAYYAWESQDTGDDACTLFNVVDVFTHRPMRTYFRDKQVHISADIVYAFWSYYAITGDDTIFLDGGAEVIYECARFLLSDLYYSREHDRYEILDVTGPDEYHERVHNNAYTNWMVAHTFDVCLRLSEYLQGRYPTRAGALIEKLDFQQDLRAIQEIAGHLYQPAPDPLTTVIPQFDGYFKLEDVSLKELLQRRLDPYEYLGGGSGLATTTQIIKQADVILALYLFNQKYAREVVAANWEYYEPRTEQGSSLSACSYAMIAAQIGKIDWAYKFFMATATIDLTGDSKQFVGTLYIGGTHPAANGGAWMAAVFGMCGLSWSDHILTIEPHLPAHWTEVTVPIRLQGQCLRITVSHDKVTVQAAGALPSEFLVRVNHQIHPIPPGGTLAVSLVKQEH